MRRRAGFTLIEMLAVILLMGLVVTASVNFYLQLSRESNAVAERARASRRATALLDRIAQDLEQAVLLVKPAEVDPLDHPWLFLAEVETSDLGADRIKFVSRHHQPRSTSVHEADLAVISYLTEPAGDDGFRLLRWSSPQLPENLDRRFPRDEDDDANLLADDVASFGVRFLGEDGGWKETWDSSSIVDSSRLPVAAEIQVALYESPDSDVVAGPYSRQVLLPLRPIDLQALINPEGAKADTSDEDKKDEENEEQADESTEKTTADAEADQKKEPECITVSQCVARHPELVEQVSQFSDVVNLVGDQCASNFATVVPIPGDCL